MKRPRKRKLRWRLKIDDALIDIDWEAADKRDMLAGIVAADALIAAGAQGAVLAELREDRATLAQYAERNSPLLGAEWLYFRRARERIKGHMAIADRNKEKMSPVRNRRRKMVRARIVDDALLRAWPQFAGREYEWTELADAMAEQLEAHGHHELAQGLTYKQVWGARKRQGLF